MFQFSAGIDSLVKEELHELGVVVNIGPQIDAATLPLGPPLPSATNLDVTAMCAICSAVCNSSPDCPSITAWAERSLTFKVRQISGIGGMSKLSTDMKSGFITILLTWDCAGCKASYFWVQECVASERLRPLLYELEPLTHPGRPMYAADAAIAQFELLLAKFGGPQEKQRWQQLQQRLTVVDNAAEKIQSVCMDHLNSSNAMSEVSSDDLWR